MTSRHVLCGCVTDVSARQIEGLFFRPEVDLLEWRLDLFSSRNGLEETLGTLPVLAVSPRHPVVAANRPEREGGTFSGSEDQRLAVLEKAVQAGADWVDLEDWVEEERIRVFHGHGSRLLLSHHDFSGTPDPSTLRRLAENMARKGPNAIKIVTYIQAPQDCLRILELIPFCRLELGIDVLAFGMGPLGRWSRPASLLLGALWAYVRLPELSPAAEGQTTAAEMHTLLKLLGSEDRGHVPATVAEHT